MSKDPYKYFRIEARELLDKLTEGVLSLEKRGIEKETVTALLRYAHTLKGAARIVKQPEIANLAHASEEIMVRYRDESAPTSPDQIRQLLRIFDECSEHLQLIQLSAKPVAKPSPSQAAAMPAPIPASAPERDDEFSSVRIAISEMDAFLYEVAETGTHLSAQSSSAAALTELSRNAELLVSKLINFDTARDNASERMRNSGDVTNLAEQIRDGLLQHQRKLQSGFELTERDFSNLWQRASGLRLMPAHMIFQMLERAVRDSADSLGKRVNFEAGGGETRLDAHVLLALRDALIHVMRNAVAHGIESQADRSAAGKSEVGTVRLTVQRKGQQILFLAEDDGRGLDFAGIRQNAERQGILTAAESENAGPAELSQLLLRGGLSTAFDVSQVSGRGIGMDVVQTTAARLKGDVNISSEQGLGTSIEILVPISLESVEAIVTVAGDNTCLIPFASIVRTVRVQESELVQSPGGTSLVLHEETMPFRPLEQILGANARKSSAKRVWTAVILQSSTQRAAIGVDRLEGVQSVVARPLPRLCGSLPLVSGVVIDNEGNPRLLLDPTTLIPAVRVATATVERKPQTQLPILVVDDSLTTRMLEQSVLEGAGYRVETAISAIEALQKTRERRYSLFLVDVEMPGMDGFELLEKFQRDPILHRVPAVLVTSRNSPEDRKRAQQVGARDHIIKSEFDQRKLLARISQLIGEAGT